MIKTLICVFMLAWIAALCVNVCTAHADEDHRNVIEEIALRRAILERLRIGRTYVSHCRSARGGCEVRAAQFARWFVLAGERYHVDPWLLVAMAMRESSMDPNARGEVGEFGLMQLHPYSAVGYRTRMECKRAPSDCTWLVILAAAEQLARNVKACGNVEIGLGAYNSGKCVGSDYAVRVLRERDALIAKAKGGAA